MLNLSKRAFKKRSLTVVGAVFVALACLLLGYHFLSSRVPKVKLADSYRALQGNEQPNEQTPVIEKASTFGGSDASPKTLKIMRLGIESRIVPLTIDSHNSVQAPANIYDVGWLKKTARPSDTDGYMVLDGHVQGPSKDGVFKQLSELSKGDEILVEQGDGKIVSFIVSGSKKISYQEPAEKTLLAPARVGTFELRLITCAGTYLKDKKVYSERLVVTATRDNSL